LVSLVILLALHSSIKYILPFVILIVYIVSKIRKAESRTILYLAGIFVVALVLRLVFASAVYVGEGRFWFPDEKSYHVLSSMVAENWREGNFPPLTRDIWLGTLHTGYYRMLASLYYLFGEHSWLGLSMNALMSSLLVFLIFIMGSSALDKRMGMMAAVLAALYPSFIFWSGFLLKDTVHTTFFVLALCGCWNLRKGYKDVSALAFVGAVYMLFILRAYSAMIICVTFGVYLMIFSRRRKIYIAAGAWLVLVYLFARLNYNVHEIEKQMIYSLLNVIPDSCNRVMNSLKYFGLGAPKLLYAPYGWVFAPYFDIHYLLYPGQWLRYIFIIPLAVAGTYHVIKEDRREYFLMLFPIVLNYLIFLLAYEGSVPRQGLHLEPILIILALFGCQRKLSRWYFIIYYLLLAAFIVIHLISIRGYYG
jgi:hypothetical protein